MKKSTSAFNVVILDTEKSFSTNLLNAFKKCEKYIQTLNHFHDPLSAIRAIRENIPDLLFLNIDPNVLNGLDVLRLMPVGVEEHVVYIAENDKLGMEAIRLGARNFLQFDFNDNDVIQIFEDSLNKKQSETKIQYANFSNKLLINKQDRAIILDIDDILYIEAEGTYSNFFMVDKSTVKSSKSLGYYIKLLPEKRNLIRINRSYVVNFDHIKEVIKDGTSDAILVLSNKQQIEFSNNTKSRLIHGIQEIINNAIMG